MAKILVNPFTREVMVVNSFCPTGEGGGVDPSCGKEADGGSSDAQVISEKDKTNWDSLLDGSKKEVVFDDYGDLIDYEDKIKAEALKRGVSVKIEEITRPAADGGVNGGLQFVSGKAAKVNKVKEGEDTKIRPPKPTEEQVDDQHKANGHNKGVLKLVSVKSLDPQEPEFEKKVSKMKGIKSSYVEGRSVTPFYVDASGQILDGHHRYYAAKKAKQKNVWVLQRPE